MQDTTEYLTSNRIIRYPFADDSIISCPNDLAGAVFGCFVDAMVQLKEDDVKTYISGISLQSHTILFTLNGKSSVHLTCTRSKTKFPVITGETDWCWYTFVLSSDGIRELEGFQGVDAITDNRLELAPRCIGQRPNGILSIGIYEGTKEKDGVRLSLQEAINDAPDVVVSGNVSFTEGTNAFISVDGKTVTLAALPGSGTGTAVCLCTEEEGEGRNGLRSPDGHVRIFNDTCYDLIPATSEGVLRAQAKCKACCTCDMYASIVNDRLIPLKNEILAAKNQISESLSEYEDAVTKWNARMNKALPEDIVLTLTAVPLDATGTNLSGGSVSGRMSRCGFTSVVRNDSFIDVDISFKTLTVTGGSIKEVMVNYTKDGNPISQHGVNTKITLQPGKSMVVTYYTVKDAYVRTGSNSDYFSKVTIEATDHRTEDLIVEKTKVVSA